MQYFIQSVIFLYFLFNSVRVLSYVPQIISVSKDKSRAASISLLTWTFWGIANLTTSLYAGFVLNDKLLAVISCGNTLGCSIIVAMVVYKRKKYGQSFVKVNKDYKIADDQDILDIFSR